jgi:hypothetical protein
MMLIIHVLFLPSNDFQRTFRDSLDEVYKLNRFPLRQHIMRAALENDTLCSDLEEEVNFFSLQMFRKFNLLFFFIMVIGVSHAYVFHTFFFSVSFLHNLPQGSKYRSHSLMGSIRIIVLVSDAIPDCTLQRINPRLQRKKPASWLQKHLERRYFIVQLHLHTCSNNSLLYWRFSFFRRRNQSYEDYCRKKIDTARAIGLISR